MLASISQGFCYTVAVHGVRVSPTGVFVAVHTPGGVPKGRFCCLDSVAVHVQGVFFTSKVFDCVHREFL